MNGVEDKHGFGFLPSLTRHANLLQDEWMVMVTLLILCRVCSDSCE